MFSFLGIFICDNNICNIKVISKNYLKIFISKCEGLIYDKGYFIYHKLFEFLKKLIYLFSSVILMSNTKMNFIVTKIFCNWNINVHLEEF